MRKLKEKGAKVKLVGDEADEDERSPYEADDLIRDDVGDVSVGLNQNG